MRHPSANGARATPVAQTRFPPSTPGATLCEKTQGFVRFLPSKHALDETSKHLSHLYSLSLHISALLYSLHISTLSTSLLSPYLCSLHISTLSTSLLFPHPYPLDISNLFTPLTRHLSTLFTPQISSHPYSLHSSNLFTSVLASLL